MKRNNKKEGKINSLLRLYFFISATLLAEFDSWEYYKVKTSGQMTSANIKKTCERNNLINTCVGSHSCHFSDSECTITALTGCGTPMVMLSRHICQGNDPRYCKKLDGVFSYTSTSSCGVIGTSHCASGKDYYDQWALCAKPVGTYKFKITKNV